MRTHRRRHPRSMSWLPPDEQEGYDGSAVLVVGGQALDVRVHLAGHLEPLDGQFHWYGRIDRSVAVAAAKDAGLSTGELVIGGGVPAILRLAEYDAWGHVQIQGTGSPPYLLEDVVVDLPA